MPLPKIDRTAHADQKHCFTCGKRFQRKMYECPTCGEWQCSKKCLAKHIKTMENI